MTNENIICMARESGLLVPEGHEGGWYYGHDNLERFATLVAAHEREACAKVCETAMIPNPTTSMFDAGANSTAGMCAAVIRARGENK